MQIPSESRHKRVRYPYGRMLFRVDGQRGGSGTSCDITCQHSCGSKFAESSGESQDTAGDSPGMSSAAGCAKDFCLPMPEVLAASSRCGSTCSKAPRAERYIMGRRQRPRHLITVEAGKGNFHAEYIEKSPQRTVHAKRQSNKGLPL